MRSAEPNEAITEIARQFLGTQTRIRDIKADSYTRSHLIEGAMDRPSGPAWKGKTEREVADARMTKKQLRGRLFGVGSAALVASTTGLEWMTMGSTGAFLHLMHPLLGGFSIANTISAGFRAIGIPLAKSRTKAANRELEARLDRFDTEYSAVTRSERAAQIELAGLEKESASLQIMLARRLGIPNDWRVIEQAQTIVATADRLAVTQSAKATLVGQPSPTPVVPTTEPVAIHNSGVRFGIG